MFHRQIEIGDSPIPFLFSLIWNSLISLKIGLKNPEVQLFNKLSCSIQSKNGHYHCV